MVLHAASLQIKMFTHVSSNRQTTLNEIAKIAKIANPKTFASVPLRRWFQHPLQPLEEQKVISLAMNVEKLFGINNSKITAAQCAMTRENTVHSQENMLLHVPHGPLS
jgi:hypothetical protein